MLKLTFSDCSKKEIHRCLQGPHADLGLALMQALSRVQHVLLKHSVEKKNLLDLNFFLL